MVTKVTTCQCKWLINTWIGEHLWMWIIHSLFRGCENICSSIKPNLLGKWPQRRFWCDVWWEDGKVRLEEKSSWALWWRPKGTVSTRPCQRVVPASVILPSLVMKSFEGCSPHTTSRAEAVREEQRFFWLQVAQRTQLVNREWFGFFLFV